MKRIPHIILAIFGLALAGFTAQTYSAPPITLNTQTAKHVVWSKPTSDAEWAEDVKAEGLEVRGTKTLENMLAGQTAKLEKQLSSIDKYRNCFDCIYWQYYETFKTYMDEETARAEANLAATTDINQRQWEVEKIQQSIERISKELELRKKGFLIVEGEGKPLFGGRIPPSRVRHTLD